MANPNLAPTALEKYQFFRTYASISWDSGTPRIVYKFTHTLAQYLPSSYTEKCIVYHKNEINKFMAIESLPIVSQAVWVSCITDGYGPGYLYNKIDNHTLFGGPWKLLVNDYAVNPMPLTMLGSETDPFPKKHI